MKKSNINNQNIEILVSEDELAFIQKRRDEELKKQKAKELAELKKKSSKLLEVKFKETLDEFNPKIGEALNKARFELKQAMNLSKESGIPFNSDIVFMELNRQYIPESFKEKWKDLSEGGGDQINELLGFWIDDFDLSGWEYWSVSSLRC